MAASLALRWAWVRIRFATLVVHVQDFEIHADLFDTTDVFALVGSLLGCGDQNAAAVTGDWSTNSVDSEVHKEEGTLSRNGRKENSC